MADVVFITSKVLQRLKLSVYPSLGVGYLAKQLLNEGYAVKIYDVDAYGLSKKNISKMLKADKPRFVGLSVMSISLSFFYKLVPIIRSSVPEAIIFAGGPHITSAPEIVKELGIPYAIRGDVEDIIVPFIKQLEKNSVDIETNGLVYNIDDNYISNNVHVTNSLGNIHPAYELYDISRYSTLIYPDARYFTIDTSRGCPYNCKFCSNHSKTKLRMYPKEKIFNDIDILAGRYQVSFINFVDDLFTYDRQRVIDICDFIITQKYDIKWSCLTRADKIDEELILKMKEAGLYNIVFGVESGNALIRKEERKNIDDTQYHKSISLCRKYQVTSLTSYIIGHPHENLKNMFLTGVHANKLNADLAEFHLMSPLPDSPIYKQAEKEKIIPQNAWTLFMKGKIRKPIYYPKAIGYVLTRIMHFMAFVIFYFNFKKMYNLSKRIIIGFFK